MQRESSSCSIFCLILAMGSLVLSIYIAYWMAKTAENQLGKIISEYKRGQIENNDIVGLNEGIKPPIEPSFSPLNPHKYHVESTKPKYKKSIGKHKGHKKR